MEIKRDIQDKYLVAFIDVLGFKEMSEEYFSGKNDGLLESLQNAFQNAEKKILSDKEILKSTPIKIRFKQFSDCVSLSMSIMTDTTFLIHLITFIGTVRTYQRILMEKGIFTRGGIAFDQHFETDNFIFSRGLIRAYENESNIAIYPRIILDQELIQNIKLEMADMPLPKMHELLGANIIKDWDGIYFLNPFDYFWYLSLLPNTDGFSQKQLDTRKTFLREHEMSFSIIKDQVERNIEKYDSNYSVQRKYVWLKEFLNWHNDPLSSKISFERMIL